MKPYQLLKLLKEERIKRDITLGEIANYLKVDPWTIGLYESGERPIDIETLEKWLLFFNLKYTIVDSNTGEMQTPTTSEMQEFKKLKEERNSLIQQFHFKQIEYLQKRFEKKRFFANSSMKYVAMLDEIECFNSVSDIAVIYYGGLLMNATFQDLTNRILIFKDCHCEQPGSTTSISELTEKVDEWRESTISISEFIEKAAIDKVNFDSLKWDDTGVILYEEDIQSVLIRDAKGINPLELSEASYLLTEYHETVQEAYQYAIDQIVDYESKLNELNEKIDEKANKWKNISLGFHPKFRPWDSKDFEATRIGI